TGSDSSVSVVLAGGPQAAGAGSALPSATRSAAGTTNGNPAALDQLFAGNARGTVATPSRSGSRRAAARPTDIWGGPPGGGAARGTTMWVDRLRGERADELVSSLVGGV